MSVVRAVCYRCFKPTITCICAQLPRVDNRTRVLVLQHPRERMHPIGTARLARLGLVNADVHVAWNASEDETEAPSWLPLEGEVGLLYPAEHARDLRSLPRSELPRTLLVLDGTWHTAKTLYRCKRWLARLPHVRLLPDAPGRYRIRREPQRDYLSTIEAIVAALQILEPQTAGLDQLLAAFDGMIDAQLALTRERGGQQRRTRHRRRAKHQRRVPHALVEGYERLLIVYGEAARGGTEQTREFTYFVAHAVDSGARFACLIRPTHGLPDAEHLGHMGLRLEDYADSCTPEEFCARWRAFLSGRQAPLIAAWNQRTLDLLGTATGTELAPVCLKSAYRAVHGVQAFSLSDVIEQQQLTLPDNDFLGRAGVRLAGAVAVAEFLHAGAQLPAAASAD